MCQFFEVTLLWNYCLVEWPLRAGHCLIVGPGLGPGPEKKKHPPWETDTLEKLDLKNWKRCHLSHVIWKTMLKWFIFIRKLAVCKALFSWKNVWKKYQKLIFRKRRSWYKNINCQSVALISMKCFRLFTFFQAVSFSIKMCFYETSDIFYFECHTYFQKVFSCLKFQ